MFRASKIRNREISIKSMILKTDKWIKIQNSYALNSIFSTKLNIQRVPLRMFAVNPYSLLSNKSSIKYFLQKHSINFLSFEKQSTVDSSGNQIKQLGTEYIKNYFIKDDKSNGLVIFQLANNSSITYDDISKHLGLGFNSISEADERAIEDILGLKSESGDKIKEIASPLYSNVTVFKEKSLKSYLPHDSLIPYVSNPLYLRHYEKLINLLSNDKVVYKYIEIPLGRSSIELGKMPSDLKTKPINYESPQNPEIRKEAVPEIKVKAKSPELKEKVKVPEVIEKAKTPEIKLKAKVPEVKEESKVPEIKQSAKTPEVKKESGVPDIMHSAMTPEAISGQKGMVASHKHELGINKDKYEDFGKWYQELLIKSEMIEYYDISGCYILRPWAYSIWEQIQNELNKAIAAEGVKNSYFPLFVSQKSLEKEEKHVEGFAPEVAWITKAGTSDLSETIAVRPTSETVMYPAFSKWIRSYRDLPLKLNQWANIVRWEFKDPTPFVRTREFLWQEGHTAHSTEKEADDFCLKMLDHYSKIYEDLLAIPVIKGKKSQTETFAGANTTYTLELFIDGNGRGMQGATSHNLGQRFSKIFDIKYENQKKDKEHVWQTCWGFTFRSIGAMVMIHSDDKGLVLPPNVAEYQVVIVPIYKPNFSKDKIEAKIKELQYAFEKKGIRYHVDDRDNYSPGWKFNHWEVKGVPIRIEIGPNEIENNKVSYSVRFSGEKKEAKFDNIASSFLKELKKIQNQMIRKARKTMEKRTKEASTWISFIRNIKNKNLVLAPWWENPTQDL